MALDLAGLDPRRPWLFDSRPGASSGPLLSRNPALAELVHDVASRERRENMLARGQSYRHGRGPIHRQIVPPKSGGSLDPALSDLDAWLLELLPSGDRAPVARYLVGVRDIRPDLAHSFPHVPGRDSVRLANWALDHGVHESGIRRRSSSPRGRTHARRPAGTGKATARAPAGCQPGRVPVGSLGIGTSARLMDAALEAAGVPTSTFAASADLQSSATAAYRRSDGTRYDTSLLAVNADQTKTVAESLGDVVARSYRIGMWYWEVESFPASRDAAFSHVDEVWVATDFVRDCDRSARPRARADRYASPSATVGRRPAPECPLDCTFRWTDRGSSSRSTT